MESVHPRAPRRLRILFSDFPTALSAVNVRPQVRWDVYKGIYLAAGVDDLLNNSKRYSNYIGAGLFLTNDDMKLLMTKLPTSK